MMQEDERTKGLFPIQAGQASDLLQQDEGDILAQLTCMVRHLMAHAPEQLSRAAYRMDLNERAFYQALTAQDAAKEVARLIFERQWRAALARKRFKAKGGEADADLKW